MLSVSPSTKRSLLYYFIPIRRRLSSNLQFRSISESSSSDSDEDEPPLPPPSSSSLHLPTVSYLVNSWGLPLSSATFIASKTRLKDPVKGDAVLKTLKDHSFTTTQIAYLLRKRPDFLCSTPRSRLLPKFEFLRRMGFAGSDLAKVVTCDPTFLTRRLDTKIEASVGYLKDILGTDESVVLAIKRNPFLLRYNFDRILKPNVETLRSLHMPPSRIALVLLRSPRCLTQRPERFLSLVSNLKDLGYEPSMPMFAYALPVMSGMSTVTWNKKVDVYRSFGWSDDDILMAFKKHPDFMTKPVERIRCIMDFLMGKLRLEPKDIIGIPMLITFSLEKTVIPRCAVLNVLISRGVLRKEFRWLSAMHMSKPRFADAYVVRYQHDIPQVLEAYEGRLQFQGFGS